MNEALQRQLQANIDAFTANITAIVAQAAREAVDASLKGGAPATKSAPPKVAGGRRPTSGRGSSLDVDTVLKEVKREGGRGVEALAKSLSVKTKQIQLPLRKLVETKKIKTKGQRRGMRYTAA